MAMSLEKEAQRAEVRDGAAKKSFSGEIRNLDATPLVKGDVFTIPTEFEVREAKRFNNAEYILVETESGNVVQFFPSVFTKQRTVCNDDLTLTEERVRAWGTAVDLFNTEAEVQKGMEKLKGKKIKVTDIRVIPCLNYAGTRKVNAQIPQLDIVK